MKDVVIVMGSKSDLPTMKDAAEILEDLGVGVRVDIVSAHRTPELLSESCALWEKQGVKVIIAGAGGAAHLPGMLASFTALPVIGVPVKSKAMNGLDALLSIAQMPKGIPLATVAVGNAFNAGLLAARILAQSESKKGKQLYKRLVSYSRGLNKTVRGDKRQLAKQGWRQFLRDL